MVKKNRNEIENKIRQEALKKVKMIDLKFVNKKGQRILITQEETDPLCMRASIGGLKNEGYYLVFRGNNLKDIEDMLGETYRAFSEARKRSDFSKKN